MLNQIIPKIILFFPIIRGIRDALIFGLIIMNLWQHHSDHDIIHQLQILVDYAQLEPDNVHAISES